MRGVEAVAVQRLEQLKERDQTQDAPDEVWKWIPAVFGFPVESEINPLRTLPLVTWFLAVVIALDRVARAREGT